jgi:hypothetical protein
MDAIRKALEDYATAWVTADADLWLSLWDEGGIQMPPGGPEIDRATLNAVMPAQFVPGSISAMTVTPQDIVVCGDWVVGQFEIRIQRRFAALRQPPIRLQRRLRPRESSQ